MGSATAVAALDLDAHEALVDRPLDVDDAPSPVRDAAVAVDAFAASAIHALFPEDVAGEYRAAVRTLVERLVAVIGPWSTRITWSAYCLAKHWVTSELFPEPATPVTTVMIPSGKSTSTCFRLLVSAPRTGRLPERFPGLSLIPKLPFIV